MIPTINIKIKKENENKKSDSISHLHIICYVLKSAKNILSQFFMEDESTAVLTNKQRQLIESWNSLTTAQKHLLSELIKEFK